MVANCPLRGLLERALQIAARCMYRRNEPDEQSDDRGYAKCESEHGAVHGNGVQAWESWRAECD